MLNKKCIFITILTIFFCIGYTLSQSQNNDVSQTEEIAEEELPEEEQILEEYETLLETPEQESLTSTTQQDVDLLQEDEGFLENLIKNPLDLNTATFSELKSIPEMPSLVARQIVRQRKIKPFQSKSEIKKLRGMNEEIYKKISPYITVRKVKKPNKLKGQIRIRIMQNELKQIKTKYVDEEKFNQPFYFYNRTQLSYGDNLSLGYVFLHRPGEIEVNIDTFKYFLRKWWTKLNSLGPFEKVVLGNYKAGFGYGLVFNENYSLESSLQSVKPKMRGLREDKSTSDNANLYGIGFESTIGNLEYSIFYSQKDLIIKTSAYFVRVDTATEQEVFELDYTPVDDLSDIRGGYIEYNNTLMDYDINIPTSTYGKLPTSKIQEKLFGLNFSFPVYIAKLGFCGYYSEFSKPFDPDKTNSRGYELLDKYSEKWRYVYRGDRLVVGSLYFEVPFDKILFYGEIAQSNAYFSNNPSTSSFSQKGLGTNLGVFLPVSNAKFYLLYTNLEPSFYSPLGSPIKIYDYPNNQQGVKFGSEFLFDKVRINFSYTTGELFQGIWSGYSTSEQPRFPSKYNELFLETKYSPTKNIELYFRTLNELRERYINLETYEITSEDSYIQTQQLRISNRYQVSFGITKEISLRFQYDQKWQKFIKYDKEYYGEQLWVNLRYKISPFVLNSKFCIFETDKDLYLSFLEPKWYNVYISETENSSSGDKFYLAISTRLFKKITLWGIYKYKYYTLKNDVSTLYLTDTKNTDHEFRFQLDYDF